MRGRHKDAVHRERKDLRIRADLMAQVDLLLLDPSRQKVDYGRWSELIEELLQAWLARQTSGAREVNRTKVMIALVQLRSGEANLKVVTTLLEEALGLRPSIDRLTTAGDRPILANGEFSGANNA